MFLRWPLKRPLVSHPGTCQEGPPVWPARTPGTPWVRLGATSELPRTHSSSCSAVTSHTTATQSNPTQRFSAPRWMDYITHSCVSKSFTHTHTHTIRCRKLQSPCSPVNTMLWKTPFVAPLFWCSGRTLLCPRDRNTLDGTSSLQQPSSFLGAHTFPSGSMGGSAQCTQHPTLGLSCQHRCQHRCHGLWDTFGYFGDIEANILSHRCALFQVHRV